MSAHHHLRHAGRNFVQRWRQPRDVQRDEALRRLDALVVIALAVVVLIVAVSGDEAIARAVRHFPAWVYPIFGAITRLGDSGYIFASSAIVTFAALLLRGRGQGVAFDRACLFLAERGFFIFAVNAVAGIVGQIAKHLFGRARPPLIDTVGPFHFDMFALKASFASFPSGHSLTAFGTALALAYMLPRWRWALLSVAVLVAVSRVIISAHYPSDVLAGASIGLGTAILLRRAFALRGITFRYLPHGPRLRGQGKIWPALQHVFNPRASR
jgi:undecaprenyl-diphosphatase